MRTIDVKYNEFRALEEPYVTGAGMPTSSSQLSYFRASHNQISVRPQTSLGGATWTHGICRADGGCLDTASHISSLMGMLRHQA